MGDDGEWHPPEQAQTALGRYYATLLAKPQRRWVPARRWMIVGAVVLVAIVAGVGFMMRGGAAPVAPTRAYLTETRAGATGTVIKSATDADLLALGQGVCSKLTTQPPATVEASMLATVHGSGLPAVDAALVIRAATAHLCTPRSAS
jgi:hypothetical protein